MRFGGGQVVVQQEVVDGYVCTAVPVRVVEDSNELLALYRARGTVCAWPSPPKGENRAPVKTQLALSPWHDFGGS